ncbi:hypothetical protein [Telluribacter humicola]|uniref:hypothetical protein n=1 Tax=Telluribacter humicola TaxID=1720261 RepID=UPI001A959B6B|nr:hypothetical protein [Telluribacter humicola]
MELDDFKQAWKQEDHKQTTTPDIMELIQQKSKGPIASLQAAFRKQMIAVTALMSAVTITQVKNIESVSSHLLFWTYIGFCLSMIGALYLNYRLTHKMESMDGAVKNNLEQYVTMMEKRLQWQAVGARIIIIFFILLLEVIPLFQHVRMLSTWHALPPVVRFASYAAYLVFQYYLSRALAQKKFGRHLDHLRNLLNEMK